MVRLSKRANESGHHVVFNYKNEVRGIKWNTDSESAETFSLSIDDARQLYPLHGKYIQWNRNEIFRPPSPQSWQEVVAFKKARVNDWVTSTIQPTPSEATINLPVPIPIATKNMRTLKFLTKAGEDTPDIEWSDSSSVSWSGSTSATSSDSDASAIPLPRKSTRISNKRLKTPVKSMSTVKRTMILEKPLRRSERLKKKSVKPRRYTE